MWSNWAWLIPLVLVAPIAALFVLSWSGRRPAHLGVKEGNLAPCPATPNCVSTQTDQPKRHMAPIPFTGPAADALAKLKQTIAAVPRAHVITETADYLHIECTSLIFRFVDDVEFWIDEANHLIHFRSASRVGYSDRGVNRGRMETIGRLFAGN